MKPASYLVLLLLLATSVTAQSSNITEAVAAYENGDYAQAIELFEVEVKNGVQDAVLYFNLGHAYYESGDLGRALLNYLRAQHIAPRDNTLDAAIARIRAERQNLQGDETDWLVNLAEATSTSLTFSEFSIILFALWTFWFLMFSVYIMRIKWHEILRVPLVGIGIALIISISLLGSRSYIEISQPTGVIISGAVAVMSGPSHDYLQHFELFSAAEIRILDEQNGWFRIVIPDGQQGWVESVFVERVKQ